MSAAIEVRNLKKTYSGFGLQNVSFCVPQGSIVGLIGENGAGKTTTIKAILNLIDIEGGEISVLGSPSKPVRQTREEIGVVFDDLCFHENLSVSQLDRVMQGLYKKWDRDLFRQYCQRFSLDGKKRIGELSKGMKMKLSITAALSHQPRLLILDEATSGLDPVMRDEILDVFLDFIQEERNSILLSSHITSDLEKVADYIVFLHQGKVIFSLPKDTLLYQYGILRCRTEEFHQMDKADILAYRKKDFEWEVLVSDREKAAQKYKKCVIDHATIDEIMLLYSKGEEQCAG
ncbi:MAG: ABC transporter ATP-binding protein [Lachnospiraceae bacterium]|nr:ABC transporter ATP-binding protein [Lachnospiraceae bacterium]